jgi:hypothetical protein
MNNFKKQSNKEYIVEVFYSRVDRSKDILLEILFEISRQTINELNSKRD